MKEEYDNGIDNGNQMRMEGTNNDMGVDSMNKASMMNNEQDKNDNNINLNEYIETSYDPEHPSNY